MSQFLRSFTLFAVMMSNCGFAFAQDTTSANYVMAGCRLAVGPVEGFANADQPSALAAGVCLGIIEGIRSASGLCVPDEVTLGQAVLVIMKYIDERPERLHERFSLLTREALQATFPCQFLSPPADAQQPIAPGTGPSPIEPQQQPTMPPKPRQQPMMPPKPTMPPRSLPPPVAQNQNAQTVGLRVTLGDKIERVRAAYSITTDPMPTNSQQVMLRAPPEGLMFFFNEKELMLRIIRADAPYSGSINGVRIGDTFDDVVARLGRPSVGPLDYGDAKGYVFRGSPNSFRCNFNSAQKVESMLQFVND